MSQQSKRTDQQELYGVNSELQARMTDLQQSLQVNKSMIQQLADKKLINLLKINQEYHNNLQQIFQQRNSAQIKSLLSEQIAEETHRREFETEMEFQEKLAEIDYKEQRKIFLIKQLKQKLTDTQEYAEFVKQLNSNKIVLPTPKVLKKHNKLMKLQDNIQKAAKEINTFKEQARKLEQKCEQVRLSNDKYMAMLYSPIH